MMKLVQTKVFFILLILSVSSYIFAEEENLSFGVGYPYFSIKYHPLELKYATGEGINIYAGRFYYNFYSEEKIKGFAGIEAGYINFDTLDMKGTGSEGSIFIGGEYFVTRKLSLMLDFAPTFINLNSNDDYEIDGIVMVANFAVYYYFSSENEKKKQVFPVKRKSSFAQKERELTDIETKALMKKHFGRATQLYHKREYQKAISEWREVLLLDPDHELSRIKIQTAKQKIARATATKKKAKSRPPKKKQSNDWIVE